MKSNKNYPVRVEQYNGVSVHLYEIDGKEYLTAEDIGRCLGLADARRSVHKINSRNREELEPHKGVVKLATPGGIQEIMAFSETGANLIGMFSRTPKARDFRLWLARLPRKVREGAPAALEAAFARGFAQGLEGGFNLLAMLPGEVLAPEELGQLVSLRRLGFTQKEAGASLGLSKDQVGYIEKALKDVGIIFPPVRINRRRRQFRQALAAEMQQIPPSPPLKKGGEKEVPSGPALLKGGDEVRHEPSPR